MLKNFTARRQLYTAAVIRGNFNICVRNVKIQDPCPLCISNRKNGNKRVLLKCRFLFFVQVNISIIIARTRASLLEVRMDTSTRPDNISITNLSSLSTSWWDLTAHKLTTTRTRCVGIYTRQSYTKDWRRRINVDLLAPIWRFDKGTGSRIP